MAVDSISFMFHIGLLVSTIETLHLGLDGRERKVAKVEKARRNYFLFCFY